MIFGLGPDGHIHWLDRLAIVCIAIGLCLLASCSHAPINPEAEPTPTPVISPTPVPEPSPLDDSRGYIKYLPDSSADKVRAERVKSIEVIVNQIVQGSCMDEEIKQIKKFNETDDTPAVMLKRLRHARIDAVISYYYKRWTKAVAYREGSTLYFNSSKIGAWTPCDFASTALHEASHMAPLEYGHAFSYYLGRELTVPYFLNSVVDRCCKAHW